MLQTLLCKCCYKKLPSNDIHECPYCSTVNPSLQKKYECATCHSPLIRVAHEYICSGCGVAANTEITPTMQQNVPYKTQSNYTIRKKSSDYEDRHKAQIKVVANQKIKMIPDLHESPIALIEQIENCVDKIIERCFSEHVERDFPMPRDAEIVACACILLALSNMRQYQGSIQTWKVLNSSEKGKIKKVTRLKHKMENSHVLKLYSDNILTRTSEVDKLKMIMQRLCNTIEIPYKLTVKLVERFDQVTKAVMMNGKNNFYLSAAVLLHCLEGGCTHFPVQSAPDKLSEDQIDSICFNLHLKKKALLMYTKQFREECCGGSSVPVKKTKKIKL